MASRGSLADIVPSGLSLQDLFGTAPPPTWAPPLLKFLNGQQRALQQSVQGKLGIGNFAWDYKTALFTHGVPVSLSTTRVRAPKGVFATSADGQVVTAVEAHPSSIPGQINVTLFFSDPSAKNVSAGLFILPDGVASGKQPAARPMWRQLSVTDFGAKGDGKADDTLAFANALASSAAGVVYVPAGTYLISSITIPTGKSLIGAGLNSARLNYNGDGACIILDGCQGSTVSGFRIVTTSTASTVRGIWLKNTTAASQRNWVTKNEVIQNSATPRAAGQVGILVEDNSALTVAQFWNTIEGNFLLNWETCLAAVQSGAGLDGVNQNIWINNACAAFITGLSFGPRCNDHVVDGLFGSHSSLSVFTDTLLVIGVAGVGGASDNNICTGVVSDMGANGKAFNIANGLNNYVVANNESSLADIDSGTASFCISTKNISGTNTRFRLPGLTVLSSGSSFSGTLLLGKTQETVHLAAGAVGVTYSTSQRIIAHTGLGGPITDTLPAAFQGGEYIVKDEDNTASAVNTITVAAQPGETIDGVASLVLVSTPGGVGRLYSPGGGKWFTW